MRAAAAHSWRYAAGLAVWALRLRLDSADSVALACPVLARRSRLGAFGRAALAWWSSLGEFGVSGAGSVVSAWRSLHGSADVMVFAWRFRRGGSGLLRRLSPVRCLLDHVGLVILSRQRYLCGCSSAVFAALSWQFRLAGLARAALGWRLRFGSLDSVAGSAVFDSAAPTSRRSHQDSSPRLRTTPTPSPPNRPSNHR
jgi:hypothetical protein